jgi:hypothetical protein
VLPPVKQSYAESDVSGSDTPCGLNDSVTATAHAEQQSGVASPFLGRTDAEHVVVRLDGLLLDERTMRNSRMLPYLQMIVWIIERQKISRDELVARLRTHMRQLSIGGCSRREYVLRYLNQHPP